MVEALEKNRLNELAEYIVLDYLKKQKIRPESVVCVDIEGLAKDYFGYDILFENIAEDDLGKTAFSANGITPLTVVRGGRKEKAVFGADKIILDRYYQKHANSTARRFTIGHELGHKILAKVAPEHGRGHYQTIFDSERKYTMDELKSQLSIIEVQANQMAAALLMPVFLMRETVHRVMKAESFPVYGDYQMLPEDSMKLKKMADDLGISTKSLIIRMRDIGMLRFRDMEEYVRQIGLRGGDKNVCLD